MTWSEEMKSFILFITHTLGTLGKSVFNRVSKTCKNITKKREFSQRFYPEIRFYQEKFQELVLILILLFVQLLSWTVQS